MTTPNDDRSKTKNPNNPAYEADLRNREKLGHGNVPPAAPTAEPQPQPQPQPQPPKK